MNKKILAIFLAALLPGLSIAQAPHNYQCRYNDLQRRVEILYETGVTVPCEVHYYKDTEAPGETQVLWRTLNQAGYCEQMAENFVEKLEDMGWNCAAGGAAESAVEPDAVPEPETVTDDTDALIPDDEMESIEE